MKCVMFPFSAQGLSVALEKVGDNLPRMKPLLP